MNPYETPEVEPPRLEQKPGLAQEIFSTFVALLFAAAASYGAVRLLEDVGYIVKTENGDYVFAGEDKLRQWIHETFWKED